MYIFFDVTPHDVNIDVNAIVWLGVVTILMTTGTIGFQQGKEEEHELLNLY